MSETPKRPTAAEYKRMAQELEAMAKKVREYPGMNHHFAERLELMARQMREDQA